MFNLEKDIISKRFLAKFTLKDERTAKYIAASFLIGVREIDIRVDLYNKSNIVILDGPDKDVVENIAKLLSEEIKKLSI